MTLVQGQPNRDLNRSKIARANDDVGFLFYGYMDDQVFVIENSLLEEVIWEDIPSNFNPIYRGQLGDKYYFFSVYGDDGFLYEYDHISKNTRKILFPNDYSCEQLMLLTDKFNNKIYFSCAMSHIVKAVLGFDGANFEVFDAPEDLIIMREDFYFAENLDQIFIWFHENQSTYDLPHLYSFDGNSLNEIPDPSSDLSSRISCIPFEDHVLLPYMEFVGNIDIVYSLYKYDGSSLVEIPGLSTTAFHDIRFFNTGDKIFIALDNFANFTSYLYKYDGNNGLELITSSFYNPIFLSDFDGKSMFSLFDTSRNKSILYAYNGISLTEVSAPENYNFPDFGGILDNKLYLGYINTTTEQRELFKLLPGTSTVQPVPGVPANLPYGYLTAKMSNGDFLLPGFKISQFDYALYAQDSNENFTALDPDNYTLDRFEFHLGDDVYYSYYNSDWVTQLWEWNGLLETPNFKWKQNDITIHPNPTEDILYVELPPALNPKDIEVRLYSLDGKTIESLPAVKQDAQIILSTTLLSPGIYILELQADSTVLQKKLIKK